MADAAASEPVVMDSNPVAHNKAKKQLTKLREQMEFYFSDSNLRSSKFLREKLTEAASSEPSTDTADKSDEADQRIGLPLALFMTFNNIKAMTLSNVEVREALATSKMLTVFALGDESKEDYVTRTKWKTRADLVKHLSEIDNNPLEFDKRTVYCENLPITANHKWLKTMFSRFGKINLVSLPTFRSNGDSKSRIKQFCFIEFATEDSVANLLKYFKTFGGVLCYDEAEADHLQSIQTFQTGGNTESAASESEVKEKGEGEVANKEADQAVEQEPTVGVAIEDEPPKKKRKKGGNKLADANESDVVDKDVSDRSGGGGAAAASGIQDMNVSNEKAKNTFPELTDNMIYDLRVMPKLEWKRLRNKYLNWQREMVKQMKKQPYYRRAAGPPRPMVELKAKDVEVIQQQQQQENNGSNERPTEADGKSRRRLRKRQKMRSEIKKNSHIFFDAEAD